MKFTCSQSNLLKAVNTVSKAVSIKTTMPVLKCILFKVEKNELILTASNLDMGLETRCDIQNLGEDSVFAVNAKLFGDIIRMMPNALVTAEAENADLLKISCLGSEFNIVMEPVDDFPSIGLIDDASGIEMNKDVLRRLIDRTVFSASIDEKRGVLTGCLLNITENKAEMTALDGFRMAVASENIENGKEAGAIIPAKALSEISRILQDSLNDGITVYMDKKKVQISCDAAKITVRLLEGKFTDYRDIVPKSFKTNLVMSKGDVISGIESASLLSKDGKNNLIKLNAAWEGVTVTSRSELGNVNVKLDAEMDGEEMTIGYNSKYLSDAVKAASSDEICLKLTSPVSSSVIVPREGDSFLYLVLPVRILS